jgi:mitofusin
MEQVMQQHLERDIKFLAKELRVTDEQTARHRVFFVSAKEVLHYRLRQLQGSADPGQGLAVGHKARLQNFEQFERQFKECLSSSAIQTKFEQHYKQGLSVVSDLESLLAQEDTHLQAERKQVSEELSSNQSRAYHLAQQGPSLVANGDQLVVKVVDQLKAASSGAIRDILAQLPSLVDGYQQTFDPRELGPYRAGLFTYFDEQLSSELERMNASALSHMYEAAQKELIDTHQALLQLPSSELDGLSRMVPALAVTYVLQCSDLCKDFHEDLRFHFSLGLNALLAVANSGSWLSSVRSQLSWLQTVVSLEYVVPAALLVAALLLPRFLSVRVLAPSLLVLGGVYSYEWLSWTPASKEVALKRQFVQHMREKVQLQVKATNSSHIAQLQANLGMLRGHLHQRLQSCQRQADSNLVELAKQRDSLSALQSRLKALRNAVQLSCTDLETFREDFLDQ